MKMIIVIFFSALFIISGCQSISSRIESFTLSIKNNPKIIKDLTRNSQIVLHDSLLSDISNNIINLDSLYNEINIFYKNNETASKSEITNKKAFFKNLWRKKFNINSFDYYWIAYCKEKMKKCLVYEFLIDKDNNLILFAFYIDIIR